MRNIMTGIKKGQNLRERVFHFVENYIRKNWIAPVYSEIQGALDISLSHVQYVLKQLVHGGINSLRVRQKVPCLDKSI